MWAVGISMMRKGKINLNIKEFYNLKDKLDDYHRLTKLVYFNSILGSHIILLDENDNKIFDTRKLTHTTATHIAYGLKDTIDEVYREVKCDLIRHDIRVDKE